MRVVYVSSLDKGGPVSHLRLLAPAVARAGANVHVLCLSDEVARRFRELGVEASAVPLRHKADLAGAARTWASLRGADVVHTHDRRAGLLVRPAARVRGSLVFHTYHGLPEEIAVRMGRDANVRTPPGVSAARIAWLLHGYLRIEAVLARFGFVVVPSNAMAQFLAEHGVPEARIHVVPHGIDVPPATTRRKRARRGRLVLGTAANLEHQKGIDVLVAACARMEQPVRLRIFGDGSWRERLEQQARELGVDASFEGHVEDLRQRLGELDVFVLPSRAENFPVAALEAMAASLPVVGTRVGGVPELLLHGETGLLAEADDPASLGAALDALAREPERRQRLGEAGRERVMKLFDADRMGARMLALYEALR